MRWARGCENARATFRIGLSVPAKPIRGGGISEQDGAHRLGGDAPAGELPAHGHGGLGYQAKLWSLRESNDA